MGLAELISFITSLCLGSIIGTSLVLGEWGYTILGALALAGFIMFMVVM